MESLAVSMSDKDRQRLIKNLIVNSPTVERDLKTELARGVTTLQIMTDIYELNRQQLLTKEQMKLALNIMWKLASQHDHEEIAGDIINFPSTY